LFARAVQWLYPRPGGQERMLIKSYFDGGNQADSTQYDVVTLAAVSGTPSQWRQFNADWKIVLKEHGADFLHTKDAVSLKKPFDADSGWSNDRVDLFICGCVATIERHIAKPLQDPAAPRAGLYPFTVTVVLKDFVRAREANPDVPKNATEVLATQALHACIEWSESRGAHFMDLYYDRNEPYRGHTVDRQRNPKAVKQLSSLARIAIPPELDTREAAELQMADLFAWSVAHKEAPKRPWHHRLLDLPRGDEWIAYADLIKPIPGVSDLVKSWKLPKRKPTR
jgi:hypothetical protein